tara:strand:+ start:578 stop:898 length:321 start_codon:yes stop_codon:yes gene_type:complete
MRLPEDNRGQEYLDEDICLHEDLYVNEITVKIKSRPMLDKYSTKTNDIIRRVEAFENWQKYLAKNGTELFELYAEVVCEECGASQEQYVDIGDIELIPETLLEWEE